MLITIALGVGILAAAGASVGHGRLRPFLIEAALLGLFALALLWPATRGWVWLAAKPLNKALDKLHSEWTTHGPRPDGFDSQMRGIAALLALAFLALTITDLRAPLYGMGTLTLPSVIRVFQLVLGLGAAAVGWHNDLVSLPGPFGYLFRRVGIGRITSGLCLAMPIGTQFIMIATVGSTDAGTEIAGVTYTIISLLAGVMLYNAIKRPNTMASKIVSWYLLIMLIFVFVGLYLDGHYRGVFAWVDLGIYLPGGSRRRWSKWSN